MQIIINRHNFRYEMENIARTFFHSKQLEIKYDDFSPEGDYVLTEIRNQNEIFVSVSVDGAKIEKNQAITAPNDDKETEWQMARLLYSCLCTLSGREQEWGILTGVRPTRLVHRMLDNGLGIPKIRDTFINDYKVSEDKFRLVYRTAMAERPTIIGAQPQDFSLYISIPFCPSRCNYCSFVSQSIEKFSDIIPQYVEYLLKEIEFTAEIVARANLNLKCVYFGGGTPTTLSAKQLASVMTKISQCFDLSQIEEYTVEAGRPDTVTREKLETIKRFGADRISINPQTFNDDVLKAIGRRHTTEQTLKAYELARNVGFKTINMDLIAGLTDDTFDSFCNSVDTAISLKPENITLHTLTVKRAADLAQDSQSTFVQKETPTQKMVAASYDRFYNGGFYPYYMYRQKNTLSNLENVGYCLSGHEGYYNICIMDEIHSIIALGAGAVTKLKAPNSEQMQRIFNYKFPFEYIRDFENIINRKREVLSFFEKYPF